MNKQEIQCNGNEDSDCVPKNRLQQIREFLQSPIGKASEIVALTGLVFGISGKAKSLLSTIDESFLDRSKSSFHNFITPYDADAAEYTIFQEDKNSTSGKKVKGGDKSSPKKCPDEESRIRDKAERGFKEMEEIDKLGKQLNGNEKHDRPIIEKIVLILLRDLPVDDVKSGKIDKGTIKIQTVGLSALDGGIRELKFQVEGIKVIVEFMDQKFAFDLNDLINNLSTSK